MGNSEGHLYRNGAKRGELKKFQEHYGKKKGEYVYGATVGEVKRAREEKAKERERERKRREQGEHHGGKIHSALCGHHTGGSCTCEGM